MHTPVSRRDHAGRRSARFGSIGIDAALLLACALLLTGHPRIARAGLNMWTSTGPDGVYVNALLVDPGAPDTVYAGTAGKGVFKSVDRGATWSKMSIGMGDVYIDSLAVDPGPPCTLYAASSNTGVFKSVDGGDTWMAANTGLPTVSAHYLAADPASSTLYLSTNDGVFKSLDGGGHWMPTTLTTRPDSVASPDVSFFESWIDCLAVDPGTAALYACYFVWGDPASSWELLESTDGGTTWQALPVPTTGGPYAIAVDPATPRALYVATYEPFGPAYAVQRSDDGGMTWHGTDGAMAGCEAGCRINGLAVDSAQPSTLYAATEHGVYTTTTGSDAWTPLNSGMASRAVSSVAIDPADSALAYAGTSDGVFSITRAPACGGDCDGDHMVSVGEVIAVVDIALGNKPMQACAAADTDGDGQVGVADVVRAVASAMKGCGEGM